MDMNKFEEGNMKCHMENLPKGYFIHSNQIIIWNVNSKYHTTTDHTKGQMKIYTMKNPYHSFLCAKNPIFNLRLKSKAFQSNKTY